MNFFLLLFIISVLSIILFVLTMFPPVRKQVFAILVSLVNSPRNPQIEVCGLQQFREAGSSLCHYIRLRGESEPWLKSLANNKWLVADLLKVYSVYEESQGKVEEKEGTWQKLDETEWAKIVGSESGFWLAKYYEEEFESLGAIIKKGLEELILMIPYFSDLSSTPAGFVMLVFNADKPVNFSHKEVFDMWDVSFLEVKKMD